MATIADNSRDLTEFITQLLAGVVDSVHRQGYQVVFLASKTGDGENEILSLHGGLTLNIQKQLEVNFKQLMTDCGEECDNKANSSTSIDSDRTQQSSLQEDWYSLNCKTWNRGASGSKSMIYPPDSGEESEIQMNFNASVESDRTGCSSLQREPVQNQTLNHQEMRCDPQLHYQSIADISAEESSHPYVAHSTDTDDSQTVNVSDTCDGDVKVESDDDILTAADINLVKEGDRLHSKDMVISVQPPESLHNLVPATKEDVAPTVSTANSLVPQALESISINISEIIVNTLSPSITETQKCLIDVNRSRNSCEGDDNQALHFNSSGADDCSDDSIFPETSNIAFENTYENESNTNKYMYLQSCPKEKRSTDHHYTSASVELDADNNIMSSIKERPFKCQQRPALFTQKGHLNKHILTHTGEKPFKCQQCPASFTLKSNLKVHLRTHTGEKPFKCQQCPASFIQSYCLKSHLLTHTGEKPFKCQQCPASFTLKGVLKTHLLTHTGEKQFKCQQCPASFTLKGSLKTHLVTHTGEKPFKMSTVLCHISPKIFTY